MKSVVAVIVGAFLLAACTVSGPKVKFEPYEVKVEPVGSEVGTGPTHCPPGHAKKNWC